MDLLFELVQQAPVQDAGVLLLGGNDDGIGFLDIGQVIAVSRNYIVSDPSLEDLLKFFTLLGIRPQYKNRMRHSSCLTDKRPDCETIRCTRALAKQKKETVRATS
jgi:hypothetical protein